MKVAKDGIRSIVRVGYDGRVYKTFRGTDADKRFDNEVKVLQVLESRGCDYVPRLLDFDRDTLTIVTTHCGTPVDSISQEKQDQIFGELKRVYGVVHDDPFVRNVTYDAHRGRFCVIDFELAEILEREEVSQPLEVSWCGSTKGGKRKFGKRNDDAFAIFGSRDGWAEEEEATGTFDIAENGIVFAVSDGMGGPGSGDDASSLTVGELRRFLPGKLGSFKGAGNWLDLLESAVADLHRHVVRIAHSREGLSEEMGATLVCAVFFHQSMYFAHVGDSRLYRFRDNELEQLTTDHTLVGELLEKGAVNEREARIHPFRNILLQAIGGGCEKVSPQVGEVPLDPGDWLLLCSDGLVDGLWDRRIKEMFQMANRESMSPKKLAAKLLDYSYSESGLDDTTLIVIRVNASN